MELVKGVAPHEPVVLLVEAIQHHAVGQDVIQRLAAFHPRLGRQGDREEPERTELLDLDPVLVEQRLGGAVPVAG